MMTSRRRWIRCLAGAGLLALAVRAPAGAALVRKPATPEAVIRTWPAAQRAVSRALIEKYGPPGQYDAHALAWFNNGPWKRTVVYRKGRRRSARGTYRDFLQQTVGYIVPDDKIAALRKFDRRLEVSPTAGELSFTSDREATNLLALNLADEIVVGKRSVAGARAYFAKSARLAASGKSSPYRERLRFGVDNSRYMTPTGGDR